MTQLPKQFTQGDFTLTQVKRSNKAAVYVRERTNGGAHVQYDVFALKSKNDTEVYPNQQAFSVWAWCPISLERAEIFFKRINDGDTVIPDVDPETGDPIALDNDPSLEELLEQPDDETPTVAEVTPTVDVQPTVLVVEEPETPVEEIVPVNVIDVPISVDVVTPTVDDPTVPNSVGGTTPVDSPTVDVQPTVDGGAVVTVAKVRKARVTATMVIPSGEFTQAQFAVANGMPERGAVYGKIQSEISAGRMKLVEMRKLGKGRPSAVYSGV